MRRMSRVPPPPPSASDIAEVVLTATARERAIRLPLALLAAFALHAALLSGALNGTPGARAPEWATEPANEDDEFDLVPLQPPPPAVEPARTTREHRAALANVPPATVQPVRSPGLDVAQAATVVAQGPESDAPVDLTAGAIVTGAATAYAGGLTTSNGTSTSAVGQSPAAASSQQATSPVALDRSSPVSLATESWSCPWPREADAEQIDEQTVVLRVVVTADGDPENATVLSDPGHGFGPAALDCAMRTRFTPARDPKGNSMRASSPPIRVRFTR
jgi:periplasmic protein TonB